MPVVLDPDAAAVYQAFLDANRPPYETLTAPEARERYLAGPLRHQPRAAGACTRSKTSRHPRPARQRSPRASTRRSGCARSGGLVAVRLCSCTAAAL